ncbi:PLP-dependent aminotransferase family protein [Enterococcus sp. AZ103]|uniref:aminotransferase-like domain-containing protein n=1 Tax=Enterococcus sp. AZ103 TaxID=2774628 RepID=UPI003F1EC228
MWQLNNQKNIPVYQQIMEQLIEYIQNGQLLPGDRLPPERKLAETYQVNRSTVVHALDELVALGWIVRKRGSGTLVNEGNWGRTANPRIDWRRRLADNHFQQEAYLVKLQQQLKSVQSLDLYTGELPLNLIPSFRLPSFKWETLLLEEQKQSPLGYLPLQELIVQRIKKEQKIDVSSDEVLITSGAKQAMFLLLQVMLQNGDSVAIEDPSFLYSLPIFATAGIRLYGVELDSQGMRVDQLEQLILTKKIKMILVNPTFQNPTGRTMSLQRRKELIDLSRKYQIPIVEDDVFSELAFVDLPLSLKELAPDEVIHLGSLSKIFGSSLKIGWIVANRDLIVRLAEARQMVDFSLSVFPQVVASTALKDPYFNQKQQNLVDTLKQSAHDFEKELKLLSNDWQFEPIEGGLYAYLTWKNKKLTRKDWELFLDEQLLVAPAFLFSNDTMSLRINYTRLNQENLAVFFNKFQQITDQLKKNEGGQYE